MISIDFYHWYTNGGPSPKADNFGVWVFALIAKADMVNRARIEDIFPVHVKVWKLMMENPSMEFPAQFTFQFVADKFKQWGIHDA